MSGQDITPACYPGWGLYNPNECTKADVVALGSNPSGLCPCKKHPAPHMTVHCEKTNCMPSPFAPHGGAEEWQSNELIMKDPCLRSLARVTPLDCDITALYYVNPVPPKY